jgi:hypothetical protein
VSHTNSNLPLRTAELIQELHELRHHGERVRTELYWNFQRLRKTCKMSHRTTAHFHRRKRFRLHTDAA